MIHDTIYNLNREPPISTYKHISPHIYLISHHFSISGTPHINKLGDQTWKGIRLPIAAEGGRENAEIRFGVPFNGGTVPQIMPVIRPF